MSSILNPDPYCALYVRKITDNGYHPIPVPPKKKATCKKGWTRLCHTAPTTEQVARWGRRLGHFGLAIACGYTCVAIDIDEEDASRAEDLHALASAVLGVTPLVRYGRAPRRILVYRVLGLPLQSRRLAPTVELIGDKRYFVSHNLHPQTGRPYTWPNKSPESYPLADLPGVDVAKVTAFAEVVAEFCGLPKPRPDVGPLASAAADSSALNVVNSAPPQCRRVRPDPRWILDAQGRVCDGREAYLAGQVFLAFCNVESDAEAIADAAWARFAATADLTRMKRNGNQPWTRADAFAKARALLRRGRIKPRRRTPENFDGFWTAAVLTAFAHAIDARGAAGTLSPATVAVSHAMTELARASGVCFASPKTLAARLGLAERTVKQARARLVTAGAWRVENNRGGRARGADYRPNPGILTLGIATEAAPSSPPGNGEQDGHRSLPVGGEATPPEMAWDGTSSRSTNPPNPLVSPGFPAPLQRYRQKRSQGVASSVAEMPNRLPAQSDTRKGGRA